MHNLTILMQFMRRDIKMYKKRFLRYLINDAIIRPILYALVFAYIFPRVTVQTVAPGVSYIGSLLYLLTPLLFGLNIDYLLDIEREKSITYKVTLIPIPYILGGRIVLSACVSLFALLASFPLASLLVGSELGLTLSNILPLSLVGAVSALMISSIVVCFMSGMKGVHQSNWFFRRFLYPLTMFGGFLAPWYVMARTASFIGVLTLANPLLYVTEGMRNALFGNPFIPWYGCCVVLMCFAFVFFLGACYLLKRNIDAL